MAPKLSELLVSEGLISPAQLEEALKCQGSFGGRLETTLVEMDMIQESDVLRCLSRHLEKPFVSPEELLSVPPDIIALIPKEIAELFNIVPVSLEQRKLTVAAMNLPDCAAIDKISFMTGYTIVPVVCAEVRVLHALEQYYGIGRQFSMPEEPGKRPGEAVPSDRPALEDVISPVCVERTKSTAPVVEPQTQPARGDWWGDNAPGLPNIPADDAEIPVVNEPTPPIAAPANPASLPAEMASLPTAAVPLDQLWPLSALLTEASGRDEIAGSVADYVYQNAERVALFTVKGRMATGWKALIREKEVAGFGNFQLNLDETSALRVVADTRSFYLGPILDTAGNQKLLAALGGGAPHRALLVPLVIMGRIVMIFYLDGGKELAKDLASLLNTVDMAGLSVEILHFLSRPRNAALNSVSIQVQ